MRWFRFYDDAVNDPKVQLLNGNLFKLWVNILCIASKCGGVLPTETDIAFMLRMPENKVRQSLEELIASGLLDKVKSGLAPHNWNQRQFVSDNSAERVKRHRAKRAASGLQSQWTAPKDLRWEVYKRDGFECVYCGAEDELSLDHKTPEMRGGTHDPSNLQTVCRSCNASKRDLTHEEFVSRNVTSRFLKPPQNTESEQNQSKAEEAPSARRTPRDELSLVLDDERTKAVIEHRQRIRKPLTAYAAKQLAKQFAACPDPNLAADTMIANGWQGVKPEWLESRQTRAGPPAPNAAFVKRMEEQVARERSYSGPDQAVSAKPD